MRETLIAQVSIDESLRLQITPESPPTMSYEQIYRVAMSVRWDQDRRSFYAVAPDLDYVLSYKQILAAVASEYGEQLILTANTVWSNVPNGLKLSIQR